MQVALLIIISSIAFTGAAMLHRLRLDVGGGAVPIVFSSPFGWAVLKRYILFAIPIAMADGYMLHQSIFECITVGVGMWAIGSFVVAPISTFVYSRVSHTVPAIEFIFFGLANIAWTIFILIGFLSNILR